jgi:hypothetical protein
VRQALHRQIAEILLARGAELDAHRFLLTCDPARAAWLVRAALAAGDPGRATAAAAAAGEISRNSPGLLIPAAAAHADGILARDLARLVQAAAGHARGRAPPQRRTSASCWPPGAATRA